jgi:hypothetical protein
MASVELRFNLQILSTKRSTTMISRKLVAIGFALQLMAVPAMAQTAAEDKNAHHYQGGPKTVVPHQMTHPKTTTGAAKKTVNTGHHYNGGPRAEPHHMGERK